jgi:coenzyme F420 hydrogenase subunit beta
VRSAKSIAEVVASGLCIGCGLCEAVTNGRVAMSMTDAGTLRPTPSDGFTAEQEALLLAACPGVVAESRVEPGLEADLVWGSFSSMRVAWAGDPDVRFKAATGGVLTTLGIHLLETGIATSVLHVGVDPSNPVRTVSVVSKTAAEVRANTTSRYGPTAPLTNLVRLLDRGKPFAVIAKPCDLGAVHAFASTDPRVDELCVARLAMVCGGQSRHEKSIDLLDELGVRESEVTLFRHRGHGNPGPTRVETAGGESFEKSYNDLWEDAAGWKLDSRCTVCPDALGETADVAAADVWPGGSPTGDDDGFNGIIVRSAVGAELVRSAANAGDLVLGDAITPSQFDDFQPHQVRKRRR